MAGIWELFIVLSVSLLILHFLKHVWSRRHYPPGPLSLPIIGGLWRIGIMATQETLIQVPFPNN